MSVSPPPIPVRGPHLQLALWLGLAAVLATLALSPYLLALMPLKFAESPLPLWVLLPAQALQAGVLCGLLGWLGLFLGARHGLDAPWLRAWVYRRPPDTTRRTNWWLAVVAGALSALLVVGVQHIGAT